MKVKQDDVCKAYAGPGREDLTTGDSFTLHHQIKML